MTGPPVHVVLNLRKSDVHGEPSEMQMQVIRQTPGNSIEVVVGQPKLRRNGEEDRKADGEEVVSFW